MLHQHQLMVNPRPSVNWLSMAEVSTSHITSQDALCQNTLGRIACHSCTIITTADGPRNYNAAVCWVLAALLHTTPTKTNDRLVSGCFSTSLFKPTAYFAANL